MKIRIANEQERMSVAAILVKNGYRVYQSRVQRPGKKVSETVLVVEDVRDGGSTKTS